MAEYGTYIATCPCKATVHWRDTSLEHVCPDCGRRLVVEKLKEEKCQMK